MRKIRISRRATMGGMLAASAGTLAGRNGFAQSAGPIRLGFVQTMSGSLGDIGQKHLIGARAAINELNGAGGVMGRQVELVIRDSRQNPTDAVAHYREMAGLGINLVHGEALSNLAYATMPVITDLKIMSISPSLASIDATHDRFVRNFFRCAANGVMSFGGQGLILSQKAPKALRWSAVISDFIGAYQSWDQVIGAAKKFYPKFAGAQIQVVDPVITKLGTTDFRNAISQLVTMNLDALHVSVVGGEGITFYQQARAFRLFDNLKAISDTALITQIGPAMKGQTPKNIWGAALWYYEGYKHLPMAQRFYKAIIDESKGSIDPFSAQAHTAIMSFAAAIKASGSTETDKVVSALESGTEVDSVFGMVKYRKEDHQLLVNPGYMHLEPQEADPGYRVAEFATAPWQELIEPPAPGVAYKPS